MTAGAPSAVEPLRFVANLSYLRPEVGGSYVYTTEILRALAARPDVALSVFGARPGLAGELGSIDEIAVPGLRRLQPFHHQLARMWSELVAAGRVDAIRRADVIWSPGNTAVRLPAGSAARQLVTVHDLLIETPFNPLGPAATRRRRAALRHAVDRADRILVPSAFVAADVASRLGVAPDRLVATGEAVDVSGRAHCDAPVPDDYLICPATNHAHKNHRLLFRALARAGFADRPTKLVLTGVRYGEPGALLGAAVDAGLPAESVVDLGLLPGHGQVLDLMARSRGVVLPSLYEGWGLPALEAVALGRPTIAHDVGGVPEFAGPGLRRPALDSVDEWAAALRDLLDGDAVWDQAAAADAARARSMFTWTVVADRVVAAARSV